MINVAILTISDRCSKGERTDSSGPALQDFCGNLGWVVKAQEILPDDEARITARLSDWCDENAIDLILTTGGTGFSHRDITPEATLKVIRRPAPGIMEHIRRQSIEVNKHAILSRGLAGIRGSTLIINLPGSESAALECIRYVYDVIPHACELLKNDKDSEKNHKL